MIRPDLAALRISTLCRLTGGDAVEIGMGNAEIGRDAAGSGRDTAGDGFGRTDDKLIAGRTGRE